MVTPQPREFPMISEVLQKGQRIKNLRAIGKSKSQINNGAIHSHPDGKRGCAPLFSTNM